MSLGAYLRSNKLNSTIPTKTNLKQKSSDLNDRITNGVGDSTKKVIFLFKVIVDVRQPN